eukprot:1924531-Prymnesium_polylepis.3
MKGGIQSDEGVNADCPPAFGSPARVPSTKARDARSSMQRLEIEVADAAAHEGVDLRKLVGHLEEDHRHPRLRARLLAVCRERRAHQVQDDNCILASVEGCHEAVGPVEAQRVVEHTQRALDGLAQRRVLLRAAQQRLVQLERLLVWAQRVATRCHQRRRRRGRTTRRQGRRRASVRVREQQQAAHGEEHGVVLAAPLCAATRAWPQTRKKQIAHAAWHQIDGHRSGEGTPSSIDDW